MGMTPADPAAPRRQGTNKASPPPGTGRTAKIPADRMQGMYQSGEQSGYPCNGTKRARIGKASGYTHR